MVIATRIAALSDVGFELSDILDAARRETGLREFGNEDFIEPLAAWLDAWHQVSLTDHGRDGILALIHRALVNRLRVADAFKRHPEILDEDVSDPIVVVGFPRSGTSALQRMLSADPAVQSLRLWRSLNPAPFPGETLEHPSQRVAYAAQFARAIEVHNPDFFATHPWAAEEADEDWQLHALTFRHIVQIFCGPVTESYLTYLQDLPRSPTYEYVGNLLRYLQWQDGGKRGRPWILKNPGHIGYIEEVLRVHPRATFVYPKRDFQTVAASYCHMIEQYLGQVYELDLKTIGAMTLKVWPHEMKKFHETKRRLGADFRLLEMSYTDLLGDPIRHIREIHSLAGRELDERGERAIRGWIAENPQHKHGSYQYSLERYGLTSAMVEEAFSDELS